MSLSSRDQSFRAFVAQHRPRLLACAWLLAGDPERAEQLTEVALARLYEAWPRSADPVHAAYAELVHAGPGPTPWRPEERVQLLDAGHVASSPVALVRDLQALEATQRQVFVLARVAGVPLGQIAVLLELDPGRVSALGLAGWAALVERDPRRGDDPVLAAELQHALAGLAAPGVDTTQDVAHGRALVRHRRLRAGVAAAVALVVLALLTTQLSGAREQRESRVTRPPASSPTSLTPPTFSPPAVGPPVDCNASQPACRTQVLRDWRSKIAQVTGSYLDPRSSYFNGYSYAYNELYETPGFWAGQPGALGLDMFRDRRGSTQVYVQIATSRQAAVKCGTLTRQRCVSTRFMDGNRYLLTETTLPAEGIEVQFQPSGDQVITVVVRDVAGGQPLAVSRGDVLQLIQDDRLRLPDL